MMIHLVFIPQFLVQRGLHFQTPACLAYYNETVTHSSPHFADPISCPMTQSFAKEFSEILIFEHFGYLKTCADVFFILTLIPNQPWPS